MKKHGIRAYDMMFVGMAQYQTANNHAGMKDTKAFHGGYTMPEQMSFPFGVNSIAEAHTT